MIGQIILENEIGEFETKEFFDNLKSPKKQFLATLGKAIENENMAQILSQFLSYLKDDRKFEIWEMNDETFLNEFKLFSGIFLE